MADKKLASIDEWNKSRSAMIGRKGCGIACPECGAEMLECHDAGQLLSLPPKKMVECKPCRLTTWVLA